MNRLTVIVVPDESTSVRRFQVPGRLVAYGPWIAAVIAILLLAGGIDYVRLRLDAVDVGRLRQQTDDASQCEKITEKGRRRGVRTDRDVKGPACAHTAEY